MMMMPRSVMRSMVAIAAMVMTAPAMSATVVTSATMSTPVAVLCLSWSGQP